MSIVLLTTTGPAVAAVHRGHTHHCCLCWSNVSSSVHKQQQQP